MTIIPGSFASRLRSRPRRSREHARHSWSRSSATAPRSRAHADDRRDDRLLDPLLSAATSHHRPGSAPARPSPSTRRRRSGSAATASASSSTARSSPARSISPSPPALRRQHRLLERGRVASSSPFSARRARSSSRLRHRPSVRTGLNGEGYIDIPFTVSSGSSLDPTTMSNLAGTFTLSGATGFSIDTTQAPVLVLHADGSHTWVYRFWTTGAYTSGTVQVVFNPGTFTGPVAPANFIVDGVATPNIHHLDVQLTPTAGNTIDLASIDDTAPELALSGPGAGSLALVADAAPRRAAGHDLDTASTSAARSPPARSRSTSSGRLRSPSRRLREPRQERQLHGAAAHRWLADPGSGAMTGVQTINGQNSSTSRTPCPRTRPGSTSPRSPT